MYKKTIERMLLQMGVNRSYVGFAYTVYAIELALDDENKLIVISKWLYPVVAAKFDTTVQCVERNIRTIVHTIWYKGNVDLLKQYSLAKLDVKPNNTQFIAIMANHIKNHLGDED